MKMCISEQSHLPGCKNNPITLIFQYKFLRMTLPDQLNFIQQGQLWAIVGDNDAGHSSLVNSIHGKTIENVSLKHEFRNLSNTRDFYYQQRFNSMDSEDSLTVKQHLENISVNKGYWNI